MAKLKKEWEVNFLTVGISLYLHINSQQNFRNSHSEGFCKKADLKYFTKSAKKKQLCQSLY